MPDALRPMSFGEILDGAFAIYRRRFTVLFATALLPMIPVIIFWIVVGPLLNTMPADSVDAPALGAFLMSPYSLLATLLIWGALIHHVSEAARGRTVSLGTAYGKALRRFLPLLAVAFLFALIVTFGMFLFIVPGILFAIMLFAAYVVTVTEDKGPIDAIRRSRQLAKGAWGRIFLVGLVVWIIAALPGVAVGVASGVGQAAVFVANPERAAMAGWTFSLFQVATVIVNSLTVPFSATALVVLYYDRRARTEAFDLEVAADGLPAT